MHPPTDTENIQNSGAPDTAGCNTNYYYELYILLNLYLYSLPFS